MEDSTRGRENYIIYTIGDIFPELQRGVNTNDLVSQYYCKVFLIIAL